MNTSNTLKVIGAIVVVLAIIGAYSYPKAIIAPSSNVGAVGTTFNTAKVAQINMSPSAAGATSTSILNTDDNNRYVRGAYVYCTGASQSSDRTIASLLVQAATSSTAAPALNSNTNLAANLTVSTTSPFVAVSSTTISNGVASVWASGSYMSFFWNATNTAACTVGIPYAAS